MAKLEYTFKTDTLFKMIFVKYPDLLKRLVSELLGIRLESIGTFVIKNPEMQPEVIGGKFCRLDISMTVDDQLIDLEIQVNDEGDYPERSLYYWAREYSTALGESQDYHLLPRTIVVSIVAFSLFDCEEFHSEFRPLEVTRHELLTDRMCLHYFELPKLPEVVGADDELKLWLTLFKAETEEDMSKLESMGVPVMVQAINAYRHVSATEEFRELERARHYAHVNEVAALAKAERIGRLKGAEEEREVWQGVVADKDATIAEQIAENARLRAEIEKMCNGASN